MCVDKRELNFLFLTCLVNEGSVALPLVVCEFLNVFLGDLTELPPLRDTEFSFDLIAGTAPISVPTYCFAWVELQELKV